NNHARRPPAAPTRHRHPLGYGPAPAAHTQRPALRRYAKKRYAKARQTKKRRYAEKRRRKDLRTGSACAAAPPRGLTFWPRWLGSCWCGREGVGGPLSAHGRGEGVNADGGSARSACTAELGLQPADGAAVAA